MVVLGGGAVSYERGTPVHIEVVRALLGAGAAVNQVRCKIGLSVGVSVGIGF